MGTKTPFWKKVYMGSVWNYGSLLIPFVVMAINAYVPIFIGLSLKLRNVLCALNVHGQTTSQLHGLPTQVKATFWDQ